MPHASATWDKRLAGHLANHPESPSIIILSTNGAFRRTISQSIGSTRGVWSVSGEEGGNQPAEQRGTLAAESHRHLHGFINSAGAPFQGADKMDCLLGLEKRGDKGLESSGGAAIFPRGGGTPSLDVLA